MDTLHKSAIFQQKAAAENGGWRCLFFALAGTPAFGTAMGAKEFIVIAGMLRNDHLCPGDTEFLLAMLAFKSLGGNALGQNHDDRHGRNRNQYPEPIFHNPSPFVKGYCSRAISTAQGRPDTPGNRKLPEKYRRSSLRSSPMQIGSYLIKL